MNRGSKHLALRPEEEGMEPVWARRLQVLHAEESTVSFLHRHLLAKQLQILHQNIRKRTTSSKNKIRMTSRRIKRGVEIRHQGPESQLLINPMIYIILQTVTQLHL